MDNEFAIDLILNHSETIEQRVRKVLDYINTQHEINSIDIDEIEATGVFGSKLSDKWEKLRKIKINIEELFQLIEEDGQIIELNLTIKTAQERRYDILVVRGDDLNVLSNDVDLLNENIVGQFKYLDIGLFYHNDGSG